MSSPQRLYELLPAIYRLRDAEVEGPLAALMAVIERELEIIEADIEGLYENWFIETADEWAIAYIADLLGVRPLHALDANAGGKGDINVAVHSSRAYVANTLRYRRRKGTAAVAEQLARDVTGWPARAVEFFQRLGTTQHMNHIRLDNLRTPDLRNAGDLELVGGPFQTANYSADVRHMRFSPGVSHLGGLHYNIPNLGLFLWRLRSYGVRRSTARAVSDPADGRYIFHPLGLDAPLFNRPRTETDIATLAQEINVPGMLRRRALSADLEQYRRGLTTAMQAPSSLYWGAQPVLQVFLDGASVALTPEESIICNLDGWDAAGWAPPASESHSRGDGSTYHTLIAVDPILGRLAALSGAPAPAQVEVSYAYGFSADVGGGPYDRRDSVSAVLGRQVTWQVGVAQAPGIAPVAGEQIFSSLADAVLAWNDQPAGTVGVIAIMDSATYTGDLVGPQRVQIPAGSQLLIVAADWPVEELPGAPGDQVRQHGRLAPHGLRPHLRGDLSTVGLAAASADAGELVLDGLLIEGEVRVLVGNLGSLQINHCTIAPPLGGLFVNPSVDPSTQNDRLKVLLWRSICGRVALAPTVPSLHIEDCIVDGGAGGVAVTAPGSDATIDTSTILGAAELRSLDASESIFAAPVWVERRQIGCVRFSYAPAGSRTPRRYRCQPDLALDGVSDPAQQEAVRARLTPVFTSRAFASPFYCQLGPECAVEVQTGGEDGAEMGVFHHLKQPQRAANLAAAVDEYLPFGLEAGLIFVT